MIREQIIRGLARTLGVSLDSLRDRVLETTPRAVIRSARHDYHRRDDIIGQYALVLLNSGPIGAQGYARDALMNLKERDNYFTYPSDDWWHRTRAAVTLLDGADATVVEWLGGGGEQ